jgi:hypothetical protein
MYNIRNGGSGMSSSKIRAEETPLILSWLAGELEKEIPDLDIHGSERKLLDFAYNDLETTLTEKLSDTEFAKLEDAMENEESQEEIKAFLKIWTIQWLEKWRERVTLCQKAPPFSLQHAKLKKKAKKLLNSMKEGKELKKMVVQRLINKGEVCMADLIAESLIIEEMAFRLRTNGGKTPENKAVMDPWDILQQVSTRIKSLVERKTPIIHLKLLNDI